MNRKRSHIIVTLCFIFVSSFLLTGCRLAKETEGINQKDIKDILCGVFVIFGNQAIPIKDIEIDPSEINLNNNNEFSLDDLGKSIMDGNEVDGTLSKDGNTIIFEDLNGYFLGFRNETDSNGDSYNTTMADAVIHDINFSINVDDEGETQYCEGTICVNQSYNDILHLYPVYQRQDGSYYMVFGGGIGTMITGGDLFINTVSSQSLYDTYTKTINGKSSYEKHNFKVNVKVVNDVEKVYIKEMNQNDELIKTTEYKRNDPEKFILQESTKYVIVEEELVDSNTEDNVMRSIYTPVKDSKEDATIQHRCYFSNESGIIIPEYITFIY